MSLAERRAWVGLLSLGPAYLVYFVVLLGFPDRLTSFIDRIALLGAVATCHALLSLGGTIALTLRKREAGLAEDERDRAIDGRATRTAYFVLIAGMILVGCVLPFNQSGWQIVNVALLALVISEGLRQLLIILGHRSPRLAF